MAKAHFKTGYNQREIVLDAKVATDLNVGDLVTFASGTLSKKSGNTVAAGDYVVAQSDMTMGNKRDYSMYEYQYSDVVKASTASNKKVAVFRVHDPDDIIVEA